MVQIIFLVIMYFVLRRLLGKFTLKFLLYYVLVLIADVILSSIFSEDPGNFQSHSGFITFVAIIIYLGIRITYRLRVKRHVKKYVALASKSTAAITALTSASFFADPKTIKLSEERRKVGKLTTYEFLDQLYEKAVHSRLASTFRKKLYPDRKHYVDRVFFSFELKRFELYFDNNNENMMDFLAQLSFVNKGFIYWDDVAFLSIELHQKIKEALLCSIAAEETLADVPFSKEYLYRVLADNGFLHPFLDPVDISIMPECPDLVEGYRCLNEYIAQEALDDAVVAAKIDKLPTQGKDRELFVLRHENENGIIEQEYGQELEAHRVTFNGDTSAEDELDGLDCPK